MKFKVGDKVMLIEDQQRLTNIGLGSWRTAKPGIVQDVCSDFCYAGHELPIRVLFSTGCNYYFAEQDLKLAEAESEPAPIRTFETGVKDTNPKDALGTKKVSFHCVPCGPLLELGLAFTEGGRKYGTHNYRAIGVRGSTYYNAALRHLMAHWEGEDIDPDSGVHHLTKAMACLVVWRDSQLMGNYEDDRPIRYRDGLKMAEANEQAAAIIEKYPECVAPFLADRTKSVPGGYR